MVCSALGLKKNLNITFKLIIFILSIFTQSEKKSPLKTHLLSILDFKPDRCVSMLPIVVGDLVHLIEEENQSGN